MVIRSRFAPSPTGRMHLGNLWIAFLNWLWTRQRGGKIILRMEDIDRDRCRKEYEEGILEDLSWMGLDFDEGPEGIYSYGPVVQSRRYDIYDSILSAMEKKGHIYPCYCSRSRIHQVLSAPHEGEARPVYDGHCRNLTPKERESMTKNPCWRVRMEESTISFTDLFYGTITRTLKAGADDFVVRRADGLVAYQLAVSIDDGEMGITHVFRGNDLLDSTPGQAWLIQKLGYQVPAYGHLPLLVDTRGIRLSKRQKGITVRELRNRGLRPEDLTGLLLHLAGGLPELRPVSLEEALEDFPFEKLTALQKKHIVLPVS
ncbi:tRNA glutamyl-Q(34) synthetase GluQRS [Dialister succinatiphilus]|uniref:tRNA glutamyl-Q(34) synthetase GluQRS n=1 Tax=Dialister succinatiphilus TaxID=487173 RepID=UPI003F816A56